MSNYQKMDPVDLSLPSDDKNNCYHMSDDDGSDTETIQMSSPDFWAAIKPDKVATSGLPQKFMLTESTPHSTFMNYPGCEDFDCTYFVEGPASKHEKLEKEKTMINEAKPGVG